MTQNDTIQLRTDKDTQNFRVFEAEDGDTVVGMYVDLDVAEEVGESPTLTIGEDGDIEAQHDKTTKNYATFESEDSTIVGMYVSREFLGDEGEEEFEAPESIGLSLDGEAEEPEEVEVSDEEIGIAN